MCIASKYVNQLEGITRRMEKDLKKLSLKQSEYDKLISEKYHRIETSTFNASEGYYLAKDLQELLRKRRSVKDEIFRMHILYKDIDKRQIDSSIVKSKSSLCQARKDADTYKKEWKYTYKIEELLQGNEQAYEIH